MKRAWELVGLLGLFVLTSLLGCGGVAAEETEASSASLIGEFSEGEESVSFWQGERERPWIPGPILMQVTGRRAAMNESPLAELQASSPLPLTKAEIMYGLTGDVPADLARAHYAEAELLERDPGFIEAHRAPLTNVAKLSNLESVLFQAIPTWTTVDKRSGKDSYPIAAVSETRHIWGCSGFVAGGHPHDHIFDDSAAPDSYFDCPDKTATSTFWLLLGVENVCCETQDTREFTAQLWYGFRSSPQIVVWGNLPSLPIAVGSYVWWDWLTADGNKKMAGDAFRKTHGNPGNTTQVRVVSARRAR